MRRLTVLFIFLGLLASLAIPALAGNGHPADTNASKVVATLLGTGETDPVATKARGYIEVVIDSNKKLLCYEMRVDRMAPVAAHIHDGDAGIDGPIVVDFGKFGDPVTDGSTAGCNRIFPRSLLEDIVANPSGYYVNVHSLEHPPGEVRGQLAALS